MHNKTEIIHIQAIPKVVYIQIEAQIVSHSVDS